MWPFARCAGVAGVLVVAITGCADTVVRDLAGPGTFVPPPTVTPRATSLPLNVTAGPDLFVALPDRSLRLRARASYAVGGVVDMRWSKIAGPSSYRINGSDRDAPEVSDLERGSYTFAISVRDGAGRVAADTMVLHVLEADEVNTENFVSQAWECMMGCVLSVGTLTGRVPDAALMRVQMRSGAETEWVELPSVYHPSDRYFYMFEAGKLSLGTEDGPSSLDVRVLWAKP